MSGLYVTFFKIKILLPPFGETLCLPVTHKIKLADANVSNESEGIASGTKKFVGCPKYSDAVTTCCKEITWVH